MGNQSVSIATSIGIQLKNVGTRRKKKKQGNVSNVIEKDYKGKQSMKKQKIQKESDDKEDNQEEKKKQGFGENLKQALYERSPL